MSLNMDRRPARTRFSAPRELGWVVKGRKRERERHNEREEESKRLDLMEPKLLCIFAECCELIVSEYRGRKDL